MGENSRHVSLSVHLIQGRLYWVVFIHRAGRRHQVANGVIEDPYPSEEHLPGNLLMEAAYAAYRELF